MKTRTMIPCKCCKGKGSIPLGKVYEETLRGVRRLCARTESFVVANRHAKWFGCKPTAMNNRLNRLEKLKLVYSVKVGKQRRFYFNGFEVSRRT